MLDHNSTSQKGGQFLSHLETLLNGMKNTLVLKVECEKKASVK
jgi:hypothetical protein